MRFLETDIPGAFVIEPTAYADERGQFARTWCAEDFAARGLVSQWAQHGVSWNAKRGTLRGLHYQTAPHIETKLVRVSRGAIFDVILDLRQSSPTYGQWFGVELSAANGRQCYLPAGTAHGFQTLVDDTEVVYAITPAHAPHAGRGIRWNDPSLGIDWPEIDDRIQSRRDVEWPDFDWGDANAGLDVAIEATVDMGVNEVVRGGTPR